MNVKNIIIIVFILAIGFLLVKWQIDSSKYDELSERNRKLELSIQQANQKIDSLNAERFLEIEDLKSEISEKQGKIDSLEIVIKNKNKKLDEIPPLQDLPRDSVISVANQTYIEQTGNTDVSDTLSTPTLKFLTTSTLENIIRRDLVEALEKSVKEYKFVSLKKDTVIHNQGEIILSLEEKNTNTEKLVSSKNQQIDLLEKRVKRSKTVTIVAAVLAFIAGLSLGL